MVRPSLQFDKVVDSQDEINPARDLTLPMLAAIRRVTDNAIDVHVFHRAAVSRTMEAPEIVRVAAPVYLKNARSGPGIGVDERTLQGFRVVETLRQLFPEARQSAPGAEGLAVPTDTRAA